MLAEDQLKNLLHKKEFTNTDKVLLCLAVQNATAKPLAEIKAIAKSNGLRAASKWNISQLLTRSHGLAVRVDGGWELTTDGRDYIGSLIGPLAASPIPVVAASLRVHLASIADANTRSFVEEGIECLERRLYRSAVVLTWVGAVAVLQDYVVANHLSTVNAEALRRDSRWSAARTPDDLSRLKEYDFLQILEKTSIIGKSVKQELEKQLKLRNGCGHPNTLIIADHTVASHIEILMLNVFTKFI